LPTNDRVDVVPRRMLELCRDALRRCLASHVELEERLAAALAELDRLDRRSDNGSATGRRR
jgi:hypothetical protein